MTPSVTVSPRALTPPCNKQQQPLEKCLLCAYRYLSMGHSFPHISSFLPLSLPLHPSLLIEGWLAVLPSPPSQISYGSLCNDTLLLDYGFVPSEANPFDFVSVPFTTQLIATAREVVGLGDAPFGDATAGALSDVPDGSTPLARWQEGALEHLGLAEGAGGAVGGAGWGKVVGAVRVVCAGDPGEIGLGVLAEGGYDYAGCEALNGRLGGRGGRGEVEVLKTLLGMTVCGMMQFQTGMQEDEELLSRGGLGGNMRLCLEYRLRKKLGVKRVADDVKLQLQAASSSRGGS